MWQVDFLNDPCLRLCSLPCEPAVLTKERDDATTYLPLDPEFGLMTCFGQGCEQI